MDRNKQIRNSVVNVLLRILFFLVYYIGLICLGAAIIAGIAYASFNWLPDVLVSISSIRLIIIVVIVWAGLCAFALVFGAYLIKPLFSSTKNVNLQRVEVTKEDCPKLFDVIWDIAHSVGTKVPKHVYLTTAVNACVFYNTNFWSIFFPVRKNLEIGLGLFEGLNQEELKSIIAHEFGHFSQNSMKVGSTVYVANSVIYDLVNTKDSWDNMIQNWCDSDNRIWATFGYLTQGMTNWVKSLTYDVYKIVQKSYLALSRQMEFDADTISCNYVGTESFVSAMYKITKISDSEQLYQHLLGNLVDDNKIIANYFKGKTVVDSLNPDGLNADIKYNVPIKEIKDVGTFKSRIEMKDIWNSHPSLEDRINNARQTGVEKEPIAPKPAWDLVPENIIEKVSDRFLAIVWRNHQGENLKPISDDDFEKWVVNYYKTSYINNQMRPYYSRYIIPFELEEIKDVEHIDNPFTESNAALLEQYEIARQDLNTLERINSGEIDVDRIKYNGQIYSDEIEPLGEQRRYVEELGKKAAEVDKDIYRYLLSKAGKEDQEWIGWLYNTLFYSYYMNGFIPQLMQGREAFYHEFRRNVERDEEAFALLASRLGSYIKDVQETIKKYDYSALQSICEKEVLVKAHEFANSEYSFDNGISGQLVNDLFQIVWEMYAMHKDLEERVSFTIAKVAENLLIQGKIVRPAEDMGNGPETPEPIVSEQESTEKVTIEDQDPFGASELEFADSEDDGNKRLGGMRIIFVVLALIVIGSFALFTCDGDHHSASNGLVAESLQEEDAQEFSPGIQQPVQEENETEQQLAENEITDGNVIIAVPSGVEAIKQDVGEGSFVYDLVNDKDNPTYAIRVLSSYSRSFNNNEFEQIWAQAKQQNEEGTVSADYGQLIKGSVGNMESYSRTTTYHGEGDSYWRLIVLNNIMTGQIAILSCWYSDERDIPIDKIISGIRF